MDQDLQKGYLFCRIKGPDDEHQWEKRYYVLHGTTASNQARLDFYNTEEDFRHTTESHGTIYIADIEQVRACRLTGREFTFELVLKTQNARVFAANSDLERSHWIRNLSSEKNASSGRETSNLLAVSGMVSLQGSQNSLDQDDLSAHDENLLYEPAENPDIFEVEVSHSPGSERNNLKGVYILRVNTLNLMLRDSRTDKTLLIWPYRYIRRYGRSKTSFTFEAGRKCTSGEGYFKFKVKDGDAVFNSVQKRTKEMKKHAKGSPTASGASAPPEYVTPILPARQYSPEAEAASGQSIHSRVKMFDKPDVKQKPPMLQKLKPNSKSKPETPSVFVSQARPDVHHSPEAGRTRITQGYELARTVYPPGYSDQAAMPYAEYNYGKTLDVSYKESTEHVSNGGADQSPPNNAQNRVLGNGQQTPGSPVYAVYDLARSSRMHVYDTPSGPEDPYYGGASADSTTTTSSSFVYAEPYSTTPVGDAWRRQGRTRDNVHIEHYDPEAGGVEADGIYEEPGDGSQVPKISAISDRLKQQRLETDDSDVAYDRIDVHKPPANPGQAGSGGRAAGRPGVGAPVAPGRSPRAPLPDIPNESEYGQLSVQPQNKAKAFLSNIRNPFKSS